MNKTSLLPLQGALYTRLSNDTAIMNQVTGVYDEVPEGTTFPYISLGEDTVTDWSTKTNSGEEITHTLHIWSDATGKVQTKQIMNNILQALSTPLSVSGFFVSMDQVEFMNVLQDPDGYKHGIIRMRLKIKE